MTQSIKFCVLGLSWGLRALPYAWVSGSGRLLGHVFFRFFGFRRSVVLSNLRIAFPEKSESAIRKLETDNYKHYGSVLMDILLSASWTAKDYRQKVSVHGYENVQEALKKGRGLYLLSCHMGSWELGIGVVAALGCPLDVIVKKPQNNSHENILQWYRMRTGANVFYESGSHHQILKSMGKGRAVTFVLDQFMGPPIGLPVTFFGQTAGTAGALGLLMERHPAPIIFVHTYRDAKRKVHAKFAKPMVFPEFHTNRVNRMYQRTQCFNNVLEESIKEYPSQWIWLHKRWKEFRGESRWRLTSLAVSFLLLCAMLTGCSGVGEPEKTGIALPPDPIVKIPVFEEAEELVNEGEKLSIAYAQKTGKVKVQGKKKRKLGNYKKKKKVKKRKKKKGQFVALPVSRIPFRVGERMEIDLTWTAIPAGKVILEVRKGKKFSGKDTLLLWGNVRSSRVVDAIYHVDNTIESYVDVEGLIPYKFLLHMVESKQKKETRVIFDHTKKQAHYWSSRISKRWGNELINKIDPLVPGALDMFSALFYARTYNYKLNKKISFMVYEKAKNMVVELLPIANELITTPVGVFQAWKVKAKVTLDNQLKQMGETYLWISDDSNRYLVKFEAKLKIGSLKGTLVAVRE